MEYLTRLAKTLPSLKTPVQLTGLVVLVSAFVVVRIIAPTNVMAQVTAGSIGILFIIFGQLFHFLYLIPSRHRVIYVLALFFGFLLFIVILVVLVAQQIPLTSREAALLYNPTLELISEDFDRDTLTWDIIVRNETPRQLVLLRVIASSIRVEDSTGAGAICPSDAGPVWSQAKYIVTLSADTPQVTKKLDPPIWIDSGSVARFHLSVFPVGFLCGEKTAYISARIEASDGKSADINPVLISTEDVRVLKLHVMDFDKWARSAKNIIDMYSRTETLWWLISLMSFEDLTNGESPRVRRGVTAAIVPRDPAAVEHILFRTRKRERDERILATIAEALLFLESSEPAQGIAEFLTTGSLSKDELSHVDRKDQKSPRYSPQYIGMIRMAMLGEADNEVREKIVNLVVESHIREQFIDTFGYIVLTDSNRNVRIRALSALYDIGNVAAINQLRVIATSDISASDEDEQFKCFAEIFVATLLSHPLDKMCHL